LGKSSGCIFSLVGPQNGPTGPGRPGLRDVHAVLLVSHVGPHGPRPGGRPLPSSGLAGDGQAVGWGPRPGDPFPAPWQIPLSHQVRTASVHLPPGVLQRHDLHTAPEYTAEGGGRMPPPFGRTQGADRRAASPCTRCCAASSPPRAPSPVAPAGGMNRGHSVLLTLTPCWGGGNPSH